MSAIDRPKSPIQHTPPLLPLSETGVAQTSSNHKAPPLIGQHQLVLPQNTEAHGHGQQDDSKTQLFRHSKVEGKEKCKTF